MPENRFEDEGPYWAPIGSRSWSVFSTELRDLERIIRNGGYSNYWDIAMQLKDQGVEMDTAIRVIKALVSASQST